MGSHSAFLERTSNVPGSCQDQCRCTQLVQICFKLAPMVSGYTLMGPGIEVHACFIKSFFTILYPMTLAVCYPSSSLHLESQAGWATGDRWRSTVTTRQWSILGPDSPHGSLCSWACFVNCSLALLTIPFTKHHVAAAFVGLYVLYVCI